MTRRTRLSYGTKRYAIVEMRSLLRSYAKARRAWYLSPSKSSADHQWTFTHGQVLGARSALIATGVLSDAQYAKICARLDRIGKAKIWRGHGARIREQPSTTASSSAT